MGLLLFAQEQASKGWWFEWVDTWGNTASVVGLLVTVIAFPVTWNIQRSIRLANQKTPSTCSRAGSGADRFMAACF
jgi:hypothetical protein